MRIVVSLLNFRPGQIGGTETYLRELIAELPKAAGGDSVVLLVHRDNADEIVVPDAHRAVVDMSCRRILMHRSLAAFRNHRVPAIQRVVERLAPDVMLFPQQAVFPQHVPCPRVLVVHDLYHVYLPQYLSWKERFFRNRIYPRSLREADYIITVSEFTKQTLVDAYGLPEEIIQPVHSGFRPVKLEAVDFFPGMAPESYVYYPAITRPHKGHLELLNSIAVLRQQGQFQYRLVLSGIVTEHWSKLKRRIRQLKLDDVVQHVGYRKYEEVQQLYKGAAAVVFPSQFEGFGLPILEATSFGKKVIVSRLDVFGELGVPDEYRVDFNDPAALRRALALPGPTILRRCPSTWQQCAQSTVAVLRNAAAPRLRTAA